MDGPSHTRLQLSCFTFRYRKRPSTKTQFRFYIRRRFFNSVKRNQIKRQVREMIRRACPKNFDITVAVNRTFDLSDKSVLTRDVRAFLKTIGQ